MKRSKSFDAIYERLLKSSGTQNDSELARVLNISPQSVNGARKRGEVPPSWVQFYAETSGVSSDWLFFGRGPMRLSNAPIDYQAAVMQPEIAVSEPCTRCSKLEAKLDTLEEERRDLAAENRKLWKENSELQKEVGNLKASLARLEERMDKPLVSRGPAEMGNLG